MDFNRCLKLAKKAGYIHTHTDRLFLLPQAEIDSEFVYEMPLDLRITCTQFISNTEGSWTADVSDVSLSVITDTDTCSVFTNHTPQGGLLGRDFTAGYGTHTHTTHTYPR